MYYPESLPGIIYGILGLSITIATFLPALVYSYNKDLLTNLTQPKIETKKEVWQRVTSFIFTNDLLLTQSMMQVFFASIYGLLIFTSYTVVFNQLLKIWLITLPVLLTLGFHWYFAFFWSKQKIQETLENENIKEYWVDRDKTKHFWQIISFINLSVTTIDVLIIFYFVEIWNIDDFVQFMVVFFICFLSFTLISFSVSWIIPLVKYKPLQSEVEEYILLYKAENEKKEGNNGN